MVYIEVYSLRQLYSGEKSINHLLNSQQELRVNIVGNAIVTLYDEQFPDKKCHILDENGEPSINSEVKQLPFNVYNKMLRIIEFLLLVYMLYE